MIVREPNREYNLDITDESCGVIANASALARSLPFFVYCAGRSVQKRNAILKHGISTAYCCLSRRAGREASRFRGRPASSMRATLFLSTVHNITNIIRLEISGKIIISVLTGVRRAHTSIISTRAAGARSRAAISRRRENGSARSSIYASRRETMPLSRSLLLFPAF